MCVVSSARLLHHWASLASPTAALSCPPPPPPLPAAAPGAQDMQQDAVRLQNTILAAQVGEALEELQCRQVALAAQQEQLTRAVHQLLALTDPAPHMQQHQKHTSADRAPERTPLGATEHSQQQQQPRPATQSQQQHNAAAG